MTTDSSAAAAACGGYNRDAQCLRVIQSHREHRHRENGDSQAHDASEKRSEGDS
jgi:hypothetical protein